MGLEYEYGADYPFLKYITKRAQDPIRSLYDGLVFYSTILQPLELKHGQKLLDVGACIGRVSRTFNLFGIKTTDVDLNFSALKQSAHLFPNCSMAVADTMKLPFSDRHFDAVMSHDLLEHLSPEQLTVVIQEMDRVSKGSLMFHRITTLEDPNIDLDDSHRTKWSTEKWTDWFLNNGWQTIDKTTKRPVFKAIHGNFLLKRIDQI